MADQHNENHSDVTVVEHSSAQTSQVHVVLTESALKAHEQLHPMKAAVGEARVKGAYAVDPMIDFSEGHSSTDDDILRCCCCECNCCASFLCPISAVVRFFQYTVLLPCVVLCCLTTCRERCCVAPPRDSRFDHQDGCRPCRCRHCCWTRGVFRRCGWLPLRSQG